MAISSFSVVRTFDCPRRANASTSGSKVSGFAAGAGFPSQAIAYCLSVASPLCTRRPPCGRVLACKRLIRERAHHPAEYAGDCQGPVSQGRVPLSQTEVRQILDTTFITPIDTASTRLRKHSPALTAPGCDQGIAFGDFGKTEIRPVDDGEANSPRSLSKPQIPAKSRCCGKGRRIPPLN